MREERRRENLRSKKKVQTISKIHYGSRECWPKRRGNFLYLELKKRGGGEENCTTFDEKIRLVWRGEST